MNLREYIHSKCAKPFSWSTHKICRHNSNRGYVYILMTYISDYQNQRNMYEYRVAFIKNLFAKRDVRYSLKYGKCYNCKDI